MKIKLALYTTVLLLATACQSPPPVKTYSFEEASELYWEHVKRTFDEGLSSRHRNIARINAHKLGSPENPAKGLMTGQCLHYAPFVLVQDAAALVSLAPNLEQLREQEIKQAFDSFTAAYSEKVHSLDQKQVLHLCNCTTDVLWNRLSETGQTNYNRMFGQDIPDKGERTELLEELKAAYRPPGDIYDTWNRKELLCTVEGLGLNREHNEISRLLGHSAPEQEDSDQDN